MSTTIFKYPLKPQHGDRVVVRMPGGAEVLTVQSQHETLCLWARVDTAAAEVERTFVVVGTGHSIESDTLTYVGTAQLHGGVLVLHVFEEQA